MRTLQSRKAWPGDRLSLLSNPSPPPSPSPFGTADPNVSTIFPSVHAGGLDSMVDMPKGQPQKTPEKRSRLSPQSRFLPQDDSSRTQPVSKEISPTPGALQFVPAYEEATSPDTTQPATSPEDSTSWDAISRDDVVPNSRVRTMFAPSQTSSSQEDRGLFRRMSGRTNQAGFVPNNAGDVSPPENEYRRSHATSEVSRGSGGKGTRMGRLASLFSSRAVVKSMNISNPSAAPASEVESKHGTLPPSPPRSDSSAGYVGWPGTQDKRGGTVQIQSSYEESDVGQSHQSRKHYQREMEEAADREISTWMQQESSFGTGLSNQAAEDRGHFGVSEEQAASFDGENPADFHLAAAVADAAAAASSPMAKQNRFSGPQSNGFQMRNRDDGHTISTPSTVRFGATNEFYGEAGERLRPEQQVVSPMTDPWGVDTSSDTLSDPETSLSKTSSAYFSAREVSALGAAYSEKNRLSNKRQAAATVMRIKPGVPQPPTEEMLALKDHLSPPHRTFNATNSKGYRGLLDRTQDVPNLMDGTESDSTASRATSAHSSTAISATNGPSQYRSRTNPRPVTRLRTSEEIDEQILEEASSDVFDGLSNVGSTTFSSPLGASGRHPNSNLAATDAPKQNESLNLVLLGGGLTTIQTTPGDFSNRITASDFDENLTNSDYDQYGFVRIPGFHEMASAGRTDADRSIHSNDSSLQNAISPMRRVVNALQSNIHGSRASDNRGGGSESGSSLFSDPYPEEAWGQSAVGDLSQYYVHPDEMKMVVRTFRKMCKLRSATLRGEELEREEDATKAFALSEMRSRIMEKDIERGLERRGGTTVVDDLVLTSYNRAALRIRDAVIVSKAWRDGASPRDVINTSLLTRGAERSYFIRRPVRNIGQRYMWEQVLWVDDTDFLQYRCASIGPRHLRAFEMFTIGDCQSILLKLSNDRCLELRSKLNEATARQIEAEELMKEEADAADGLMTEAEMTYLTSMEEVKSISHKLVVAESSFTLVRDRIEELVAKYEALLLRFENEAESVAASSVISYESSYYSDDYSSSEEDAREKLVLARRAQRAELRAEVAAREALLSKQNAHLVRAEKERELNALHVRLSELQSESSAAITEKEHSLVLARAITAKRANQGGVTSQRGRISKSKLDGVKQRFRDRTAAKMTASQNRSYAPEDGNSFRMSNQNYVQDSQARERSDLFRTVGEEMFQHLDFYERSLKAVENTRPY